MNYIAVSGFIASGKTTVTKIISERDKIVPVFEKLGNNPILASFYKNPSQFALDAEFFITIYHYHLIKKASLNNNRPFVSDFFSGHDLLFAKLNLSKEDFKVYKLLFDNLDRKILHPDLIIYLNANTKTLFKRIKNRKRNIEKNISWEYLDKLNKEYKRFFTRKKIKEKTIEINIEEYDFVSKKNDLKKLYNILDKYL